MRVEIEPMGITDPKSWSLVYKPLGHFYNAQPSSGYCGLGMFTNGCLMEKVP
jgi:hypothetical protein